MPASDKTIESLKSAFSGLEFSEFRGQTRVRVSQESQFATLEYLCRTLGFDFLVDVTCVDMLNLRDAVDRFQLIYQLTNTAANERISVLVMLNEPNLTVKSVYSLWNAADWLEREAYDMFGIVFEGHPDLRRILLPEEFAAHPLRKDYPLQGRGERHNFPVIRRNQA